MLWCTVFVSHCVMDGGHHIISPGLSVCNSPSFITRWSDAANQAHHVQSYVLDYSFHILAIYKFSVWKLQISSTPLLPLMGGKIHSFPTNVYNFQRWEWVFGCGIARASNLQLLEIGETVAFFSLSLAHDSACWDRLTCNILPLLNSTEKSETIYIYFLITIWRHEEKWIECLRKWFAHHVLSITRKYQSDAGCLHAERNDTKFIRT